MNIFVTIGIPVAGGQQYWQLNIAAHTKVRVRNGDQLSFYRALGIPEHTDQSPALLEGYRDITEDD